MRKFFINILTYTYMSICIIKRQTNPRLSFEKYSCTLAEICGWVILSAVSTPTILAFGHFASIRF